MFHRGSCWRQGGEAPAGDRFAWFRGPLGSVRDNADRGWEPSVPVMQQNPVGECALRLQVPATVEHLRTVRLVAADAAERAGFDCDQTDDIRIAVDELCHA